MCPWTVSAVDSDWAGLDLDWTGLGLLDGTGLDWARNESGLEQASACVERASSTRSWWGG